MHPKTIIVTIGLAILVLFPAPATAARDKTPGKPAPSMATGAKGGFSGKARTWLAGAANGWRRLKARRAERRQEAARAAEERRTWQARVEEVGELRSIQLVEDGGTLASTFSGIYDELGLNAVLWVARTAVPAIRTGEGVLGNPYRWDGHIGRRREIAQAVMDSRPVTAAEAIRLSHLIEDSEVPEDARGRNKLLAYYVKIRGGADHLPAGDRALLANEKRSNLEEIEREAEQDDWDEGEF
jgi:hypothetical protein